MVISLLRAIVTALFAGLLLQNSAMCADMAVDKSNSGHELVGISITGEIKPGDDLVFARLARGAKEVWLNLDSEGGDIDAAMGIGSILRKHDGIVRTGKCYSACVLIVAGGVIRVGADGLTEPVIGVHRMFFPELPPGLTQTQVKSRYDVQLNRVRSYLTKMDVSPELLSFMQSIDPSDIHFLTPEELNRYGLGSQDVIYNERLIADRAAELGISSLEYRRREQRGRDECNNSDCAMAIHYGTSVEIYRQRRSQVYERCGHYTDQMQQNRCEVHFMATGRAIP